MYVCLGFFYSELEDIYMFDTLEEVAKFAECEVTDIVTKDDLDPADYVVYTNFTKAYILKGGNHKIDVIFEK